VEKKSLVIVESPAKAKTINKILGKNFTVKASVGHIKNLPDKTLGIDIENGFTPEYVLIKGKEKVVSELKSAARAAQDVYLAPDPDREGEAIAWHIASEIKSGKKSIYRVTFNEITKKAVLEAFENPGKINMALVDAQQARRVLDRLVGYSLSPLLWKKVARGLSAGRVQSVALRLVVERENEINAFKSEEYWHITIELEGSAPPVFSAKLLKIGKDKAKLTNEAQAKAVLEALEGCAYVIDNIEKKNKRRAAAPPFITSTLQQEAARKLRFTTKKTMSVAQKLYEGIELGEQGAIGLITYMRTDSVRVANEAQVEAGDFIEKQYGKDYVPKKPNVYKSKGSAQEGHEAVRPTYVTRTPESLKSFLTPDQLKLYTLIWKRFVASQMSPAELEVTSVDIKAGDYIFRASGTVVKFPGYMTLYMESTDDQDEKEEGILPPLTVGEILKLLKITPSQHFTQPPPRYTEASLVKELDAKGIGRPSTYAYILSTIQERKYVEKIENKFKPTELGILVCNLLIEKFPDLMDIGFTAKMEDKLDSIELGKNKWTEVLQDFYVPFDQTLNNVLKEKGKLKPADEPTDETCEKCGSPMVIKWSRYGKFLSCSMYPNCKHAKPLNNDKGGMNGNSVPQQETDEKCPNCGSPMVIKSGRFGRFMACSAYPKCKTAKSFSIGVKCPKDGGDISQKRSKKGRIFYGCCNYPSCDFVTWQKPYPKPCPKCNAPFLLEKQTKDGGFLVCNNKDCGYEEAKVTDSNENV